MSPLTIHRPRFGRPGLVQAQNTLDMSYCILTLLRYLQDSGSGSSPLLVSEYILEGLWDKSLWRFPTDWGMVWHGPELEEVLCPIIYRAPEVNPSQTPDVGTRIVEVRDIQLGAVGARQRPLEGFRGVLKGDQTGSWDEVQEGCCYRVVLPYDALER